MIANDIKSGVSVPGLNEANIPPHLLPRSRAWYARQIAHLEQVHGPSWPNVREWLEDYVNAELREHLEKVEDRNVL
ncbi:MAG: hypothetical protein WAW69_11700 [Polaromonas sp.]